MSQKYSNLNANPKPEPSKILKTTPKSPQPHPKSPPKTPKKNPIQTPCPKAQTLPHNCNQFQVENDQQKYKYLGLVRVMGRDLVGGNWANWVMWRIMGGRYKGEMGIKVGEGGVGGRWQRISAAWMEIYNINFMGKKPQKCRKNCTKHRLILKPVQYYAYISRGVEVSFCPPSCKHHTLLPVFNRDGKHYTSSFMLKEDQTKYVTNDLVYRKEHQNFCMEQLNGKEDLLVPKPRTKIPYCHICRDQYQDFLDHINSAHHKTCITSNKFSTYITDLINENYRPLRPALQFADDAHEQSSCEKQINSSATLPSTLALDDPQVNQGFTFVSGQGAFQLRAGCKLGKLHGESLIGENPDIVSPYFDKLLRRCSTTTQLSQKKPQSFTKFPIIITPLQ